jgi:hypothetical protein
MGKKTQRSSKSRRELVLRKIKKIKRRQRERQKSKK